MKFDFYLDPGHGWLKVKKDLLLDLGITDKISHYSYERGAWAYLEEDCDVPKFMAAYHHKYIDLIELNEHHTNKSSKIRSYQSFYDFNKFGRY